MHKLPAQRFAPFGVPPLDARRRRARARFAPLRGPVATLVSIVLLALLGALLAAVFSILLVGQAAT